MDRLEYSLYYWIDRVMPAVKSAGYGIARGFEIACTVIALILYTAIIAPIVIWDLLWE